MPDLPRPVTAVDEYLAAIHGVLADIRDRLPAPAPVPPAGQVELREPAAGASKPTGGRAKREPGAAPRPARTSRATTGKGTGTRSSRKENSDG